MVFIQGDLALDLSLSALSPIIYLGLFSTLIAFGLQTYAQQFTTSNQASLILSTEAFFGMIAAVIILNEALTANLLLGAVLIFCGILVVELKPFNRGRNYQSLDEKLKEYALTLASHKTAYYTCHCTGTEQYEFMKKYMPQLSYLSCGQSIEI